MHSGLPLRKARSTWKSAVLTSCDGRAIQAQAVRSGEVQGALRDERITRGSLLSKRRIIGGHRREKMTKKMPRLIFQTGRDALNLRRELKRNQTDFWGQLNISQSGGSRYESGRVMPEQVVLLLHLVYGTEKQAGDLLNYLRRIPAEN